MRCQLCKLLIDGNPHYVGGTIRVCESCVKKAVPVEIHDGDTNTEETIWRVPVQRNKYQAVTYKGKRYQLFGGIRTPWRIQLSIGPLSKK